MQWEMGNATGDGKRTGRWENLQLVTVASTGGGNWRPVFGDLVGGSDVWRGVIYAVRLAYSSSKLNCGMESC